MTEHRLEWLVIGKLADELKPAETVELDNWGAESAVNKHFLEVFSDENLLTIELDRFTRIDRDKGYAKVQALIRASRRSRLIRITAWSAAACILLAIAGLSISRWSAHRLPAATTTLNGPAIPPGWNRGTVTSDPLTGDKVLTTQRTGQYKLELPDGSHVWLNDSTTLRFPATFPGSQRTVTLTGEAYFQIAEDAARPFVVKLKDGSVEVLGTSFDCSSYPGEGTTTTLLRGAVRVRTANDSVVLTPNDQAAVKPDGTLSVENNAPAALIAGWKDGYFFFNHTPLDQVMRQLARWYDIEVVDATGRAGLLFDGKVDRGVPLDELPKTLDNNQNHLTFQLENHKLIILSN